MRHRDSAALAPLHFALEPLLVMRRYECAQARSNLGACTRKLNEAVEALQQTHVHLYGAANMPPLRRIFERDYAQRHAHLPELEQSVRTGREQFVRANSAYQAIASLRDRRAAEHRRKRALAEERRLEELR